MGRRGDSWLYDAQIEAVQVQPPVFILGHWRSGTTHLHNLLTLDDRFAFPNYYQVSFPHQFLCTEWLASTILAAFLPRQRPMDNVRVNFQAPNEDEFALCSLTQYSPCVGFSFPRRQEFFDQFLTFRGAPPEIVARWKAAFTQFLKKLTWKYNRPLVLKSPPHTCRIRLLLDLFPEACFVHIHRNPYDVFQSNLHWHQTAGPWFHLQRADIVDFESRILRVHQQMYEVFFKERPLIPAGRFCEVSFEELEVDAVGQIRRIYEILDLPEFSHVESRLQAYLDTVSGYQKNQFPEASPVLRERIAREWEQSFDEWSYVK